MMDYPAEQIKWRQVESTNVRAIGWDRHNNMYVQFHGDWLYMYPGVSRQRAVAASLSRSVGAYVHYKIKPAFPAIRLRPAPRE
jgi:hypothetical protein